MYTSSSNLIYNRYKIIRMEQKKTNEYQQFFTSYDNKTTQSRSNNNNNNNGAASASAVNDEDWIFKPISPRYFLKNANDKKGVAGLTFELHDATMCNDEDSHFSTPFTHDSSSHNHSPYAPIKFFSKEQTGASGEESKPFNFIEDPCCSSASNPYILEDCL